MNGDCVYKEQGVCCNTTSEWLADFPAKEDCRKCGYYAPRKENSNIYVHRNIDRERQIGKTNQQR